MVKRFCLNRTAAGAVVAMMCCASASGAPPSRRSPDRPPRIPGQEKPLTQVVDIALDDARTLRGRFVDSSGGPIDGAIVALKQGERVIAGSTTRSDGSFQIEGVPSGSYRLSCGSAWVQVRCWTAEAAPPNAVIDGVTFQDSIVRGQAIAVAPALLGSSAMTTAAASGMAIGGVATYAAVESDSNRAATPESSENLTPTPSPAPSTSAGQIIGRDAAGNLIRVRGQAPWEQNGSKGPVTPSDPSGIVLPSNLTATFDSPRLPASP